MAQTIAPDRTPVELAQLPPADALYQIAGWLDDCDNHLATHRPGGLPRPWFGLFEAFAAVREAAGRAPPATTWVALEDIKAERRRQVDEEGYTPEQDDAYAAYALPAAAAAYAFSAATSERYLAADPLGFWPWPAETFKPSTPRRDLVKAGAVILAAIERLDRAAANAVREEAIA